MDTILVNKVVAKDGKKPWKLYDGNGVEYVTWDDALGASAQALQGEQAKIDVTVTEKPGQGGAIFVNRLLNGIEKAEPEPVKRDPDYEPSVNFGKQVVIIRQNAWSQTNAIYDKATQLYMATFPPGELDVDALHAIAWQLYSASKRPEKSTMQTIAADIEKVVRYHFFPIDGEELPF